MSADTLNDIPVVAHHPLVLNELIFSQLRSLTGVIVSGLYSAQFCLDSESWGSAIQLSHDETLQMRIFPKGLLSGGQLLEQNGHVLLAARRCDKSGKDTVTLAILWDPTRKVDVSLSPLDCFKMNKGHVACRNLPIIPVSLFNRHDAVYGGAADSDKPQPVWPALDESNFYAVRPNSFTVTRSVRVEDGSDSMLTIRAAPGISQFVTAGFFAGVDCADLCHRAAEPVTHSQWLTIGDAYSSRLVSNVGNNQALQAIHNASTVSDLLSAEGLLGILSHGFCLDALPDMLHSPEGCPLLIAFSVRLACYPGRYGLAPGTAADTLANNEVNSLFEANWEPITPEKAGECGVYAIDVMMKGAFKDAMAYGKRMDTRQSIIDNVIYWQRSGQQCSSNIFGPSLDDFLHTPSQFGRCEQLTDPLEEARNRALRQIIGAHECGTGLDSQCHDQMASPQKKRSTLLMVLNSVEHWARTGQYCGMQIHTRNMPRPKSKTTGASKVQFRQQLNDGVETCVKEMLETGEYADEKVARETSEILKSHLEAFAYCDIDAPENAPSIEPQKSPEDGECTESDSICYSACLQGMAALTAAMCQGTLIMHQFDTSCFLTGPEAVNKCADCNVEVHALTSTFLSTHYGACQRCRRPRCLACASKIHSIVQASNEGRDAEPTSCLRCRASTPEGVYGKSDKKSKKKARSLRGKRSADNASFIEQLEAAFSRQL